MNHSAQVSISLHLPGRVLPIAQLGPDFLSLREPADFGPCMGEIVFIVDGNAQQWRVLLPAGSKAGQDRVAIEPLKSPFVKKHPTYAVSGTCGTCGRAYEECICE